MIFHLEIIKIVYKTDPRLRRLLIKFHKVYFIRWSGQNSLPGGGFKTVIIRKRSSKKMCSVKNKNTRTCTKKLQICIEHA